MFRKIHIIVAVITFIINIFLIGLNRGYDIHFDEQGLYNSGFELLTYCYIYISLLLLLFIVGKSIKKNSLSNIICFTSIFLLFYPYKWVYLQKQIFYSNNVPLDLIFKESIPLDVISILLIIILLTVQIITVFQSYFEWKCNNTKVE